MTIATVISITREYDTEVLESVESAVNRIEASKLLGW